MDIRGKVAVVTGGGSGIGAAMARRFAADGAKAGVDTPVIALIPTPEMADPATLLDVVRRLGPGA